MMLTEPARETPVVAETDVLVVGGGPAGLAAAVTAARLGVRVILTERASYLGGLATGGEVLLLDDMANLREKTVGGLCAEIIDRLEKVGAAVATPQSDWFVASDAAWGRWGRWGFHDDYARTQPKTITYAVAFDPEALKLLALQMVHAAGVQVRLQSLFVDAVVRDGTVRGGIFETKAGRHAILARIVVDTTGDGDVFARAGAPHAVGKYIMTLVHRLGNVDVERAERFEREHPAQAADLNRVIKGIYGGAWDYWWLRTPLDGVVWCNCPHLPNLDGLSVEDMSSAEFTAHGRIAEAVAFARGNLPGFERAVLLDTASQLGVRQTRLLRGEYVLTKEDVVQGRWFWDRIGRGRDYYYPFRVLLPREVDNLLVAGRCFSATPEAQRMAREIPPMMVLGEAAGVAAALSVQGETSPRRLDVGAIQQVLLQLGANLGPEVDPAAANAASAAAGGSDC